MLEQAKSLADQEKLPEYANTGTMTYTEFLTLPKPHQRNKIKKVIREMHGLKDKDTVSYLPTVGQKARSYSLLGNRCTVQAGVITAYTGDTQKKRINLPLKRIPIFLSLAISHISKEEQWDPMASPKKKSP